MKRNIVILSLFTLLTVTSSFIIVSNGIPGATGSPGELTCASCHLFGSGTTQVNIGSNPAFISGQYIPNQVYTITITVENINYNHFGFGCEILDASDSDAGVISNPGAGVITAISTGKTNAIQSAAKAGPGSADFSFRWTAPTGGVATIYAAGNAVNNDAGSAGDMGGNTSLALTPLTTTNIRKEGIQVKSITVFPNPIASRFNIGYNLIQSGNVKVGLYDLRGREVTLLINEEQDAGIKDLTVKLGEDIAAGIYLIKLSFEDKPVQKRLIIKQ